MSLLRIYLSNLFVCLYCFGRSNEANLSQGAAISTLALSLSSYAAWPSSVESSRTLWLESRPCYFLGPSLSAMLIFYLCVTWSDHALAPESLLYATWRQLLQSHLNFLSLTISLGLGLNLTSVAFSMQMLRSIPTVEKSLASSFSPSWVSLGR